MEPAKVDRLSRPDLQVYVRRTTPTVHRVSQPLSTSSPSTNPDSTTSDVDIPVALRKVLYTALTCPFVFESRYPDDEAGEIPMAYVVRKPGSTISATQIMDSVAKQACFTYLNILSVLFQLQVAPYKKIRRVAFINSIPKSPAGKILRRELVNYALSSSPSSKL
ncbi:hypothetical protein RD792_008804 [Penstemon davidsonii]|uniref:AMP-binding enzyme C-terminal domain-containing protein n=1 Tax=Penstemon davidsonii TaxID=160366 RepID=A0ABR0DA47_9LAMI|nr:hypothetical protein RD792_008804 [Penstemon davidsonii]